MPVSRPGFIAELLCGYVAAVLATAALANLPSRTALLVFGIGIVGALICRRLNVLTGVWLGVLLGVVIAATAARDAIEHRLAACVDGTTVELRATVIGLPKLAPPQSQFDIEPNAIEPWPVCAGPMPRHLRLSWFGGPVVTPGEIWQLRIKLRAVRGYQNPAGFDYEAWSLANRIDGSGTVRFGQRRAVASGWSWNELRLDLRARIGALGLLYPGIVLALLTGDGALMSDADWDLFRATGTVHLMVISGLHLTIVATVGAALGRALSRMSRGLLARSGDTWPGLICAMVLVTLYACLAGWGVPVLRSWVALMLVLFALPLGRRLSLPMMFLWVAAIVLTCDPLAPLQAGFWLSFGAVAVLLAQFAPRSGPGSTLRALVIAQVVLAVAMVPALLATVGGVAWVGPLANLLAVPLVSVVVVPVDLVAGIWLEAFGDSGGWLLQVADWIVAFVVGYLRALAQFDWTGWRADRGIAVLLLSAVAAGAMLLPLTLRHRILLLPCVLLPLVPLDQRPSQGEFRVTVLDVGQGLAVVVQTARHRLLYDAGPRFPSGFDLGSAVVLPSLRRANPDGLDLAVLSHADMDHVGGYRAVSGALAVRALIGGEPVAGLDELRACRAGQGWQWDGVQFEVLHPTHAAATDNDRSCVLLIDNGRRRALLPGDITRIGESAVLLRLRTVPIDFMVAAHHGSRSSSTAAFVRATQPRIVAISAGHLNRFGHPHPDVMGRYEAAGARVFVTAASGALTWSSAASSEVQEMRTVSPPYWRVGGRSAEAMHHKSQLFDEQRFFVLRQKSTDLDAFIARKDCDLVPVPRMTRRFHEKTGEKARETIDPLGSSMAHFDDQFIRRKGQHLLSMGAAHAHIKTPDQRTHLERAER